MDPESATKFPVVKVKPPEATVAPPAVMEMPPPVDLNDGTDTKPFATTYASKTSQ